MYCVCTAYSNQGFLKGGQTRNFYELKKPTEVGFLREIKSSGPIPDHLLCKGGHVTYLITIFLALSCPFSVYLTMQIPAGTSAGIVT